MRKFIILISLFLSTSLVYLTMFCEKHGPRQVSVTQLKAIDVKQGPLLDGAGETVPVHDQQETLQALAKQISVVSGKIEASGLIEKANVGQLSESEVRQLKKLLREYDRLQVRKVDLLLGANNG